MDGAPGASNAPIEAQRVTFRTLARRPLGGAEIPVVEDCWRMREIVA